MLVGRVVIDDQMEVEIGRNIAVKMLKEGEEFLVAMAGFALGDYFPGDYFEGGKKRSGAMSKVVMGDSFDIA
jgi:hypothetical protein